MPYSQKQRRAAFAALARKKAGGGDSGPFSDMSAADLETYAHSPLEKKAGKRRMGPRPSAAAQAKALRG